MTKDQNITGTVMISHRKSRSLHGSNPTTEMVRFTYFATINGVKKTELLSVNLC